MANIADHGRRMNAVGKMRRGWGGEDEVWMVEGERMGEGIVEEDRTVGKGRKGSREDHNGP